MLKSLRLCPYMNHRNNSGKILAWSFGINNYICSTLDSTISNVFKHAFCSIMPGSITKTHATRHFLPNGGKRLLVGVFLSQNSRGLYFHKILEPLDERKVEKDVNSRYETLNQRKQNHRRYRRSSNS